MDKICCYPGYGGLGEPAARPQGVSLSGSSFLSSTLFTLFTEVGCRGRGGPGAEPCALIARDNGALSAKCCPGGTTAVQSMQMVYISL